MVSECNSGVQAYIMCQVGTRIHPVVNFIGVLNNLLFFHMNNVFRSVLQLIPVAKFLDQHIVWQSTAEF